MPTSWTQRTDISTSWTQRDLDSIWFYVDEADNFYIDESWNNYIFVFSTFSTSWTERVDP